MPATPSVQLNPVQVLAIAALGVAAGASLKQRVRLLDRLHIPASVLGGMVGALLLLALRDRWLNVEMDMALRDILMVAFFTSVGLSARLQLIVQGGRQVLVFWMVATAGAVLQGIVGISAAMAMGVNPLVGLVCGPVTLAGGPATALAFGSTFEGMGLGGATTLGIAAAMFGIASSGLLGGFAGGRLIEKHGLRPIAPRNPAEGSTPVERMVYGAATPEAGPSPVADRHAAEQSSLLRTVVVLAVAMGLGTLVSAAIQRAGAVLPAYIGAMIAACLIRNLDDRFHFARIAQRRVDELADVALNLFIVMALLGLRLWELAHLAAPALVILIAQVALTWLVAAVLAFRVMGRDYQSAVMTAGYVGFMVGTTANALACLQVLVEKYGPAPRALIIVSLVGAFLIDFTNALAITGMANLVR